MHKFSMKLGRNDKQIGMDRGRNVRKRAKTANLESSIWDLKCTSADFNEKSCFRFLLKSLVLYFWLGVHLSKRMRDTH